MDTYFKLGDIVDYPSGKKFNGVIKKIICKLCNSSYQCRCQNVFGVKITVEWGFENGHRKRNRYVSSDLILSPTFICKEANYTQKDIASDNIKLSDIPNQKSAVSKYNCFVFDPNRLLDIKLPGE